MGKNGLEWKLRIWFFLSLKNLIKARPIWFIVKEIYFCIQEKSAWKQVFSKSWKSISDIIDPVKRFDLISFEGDFGGRYYISLTRSTEKFYVCLIDLLLQLHFSVLQNNCFQFAKKKLSSELYLKLSFKYFAN